MGLRGPKPKSAAQKKADGNRGKRKPKTDARSPAGAPQCPATLTGEARKEWDRITAEMKRVGTLANTDRAAIAEYCRAYVRRVAAFDVIEKEGATYEKRLGDFAQRPDVAIEARFAELCYKYLTAFGLTSQARANVRIEPPDDAKDDLKKFQEKRR